MVPTVMSAARGATRRLGPLIAAGLAGVGLIALSAWALDSPAYVVLVIGVAGVAAVLGGVGMFRMALIVRRLDARVGELGTVVPAVRSLDAHVGATRRQLRVAIEQELTLGVDRRSRRIVHRDIRRLRDRLWSGFEREAIAQLELYQYAPGIARGSREFASIVASQWHHALGSEIDAYRSVALARVIQPNASPSLEQAALEADYLVTMGRLADARGVLDLAIEAHGTNPEMSFRMANSRRSVASEDIARLADINEALAVGGLAPLAKRVDDQPLTLANLRTVDLPVHPARAGEPVISVIMPMRNAEPVVGYALRSVLEQTWPHLQVVVVDDGSHDASTSIVESIARRDPRVELHVRRPAGAYAARNFGLSRCEGQYITVHDADDWSHPEKLERQVNAIRHSDGRRGSWSYWIRCSHSLVPCEPSLRPQYRRIVRNYSSLMFDRSVFDDLGPWDEATVSSDGEFRERFETFDGSDALVEVLPDVPLALGLRTDQSLTAIGTTGILSIHHTCGTRRQYRDVYRAWHTSASFLETLPLDLSSTPFSRPRLMDPVRRLREEPCDVALLGELSDEGDRGAALGAVARAVSADGHPVGLVHLPRDGWVGTPLPETLLALDGDRLRMLSSGENVDVGVVVIDDASVLSSPLARAPKLVSARRARIIVRRSTSELDRDTVLASLAEFGLTSARWQAANPTLTSELHEFVSALGPDHDVADGFWPDLIVVNDEIDPATPFEARVRLLGIDQQHESHVRAQILDSTRLRQEIDQDDSVDSAAGADVLAPDDADEVSCRSEFDVVVLGADAAVDQDQVLEALARAVPICADPRWAPVLGDGAQYAAGDDLVATVESMLDDPVMWKNAVEAARNLADSRHSSEVVVGAFRGFLAAGPD